jgi:hypothetical protein
MSIFNDNEGHEGDERNSKPGQKERRTGVQRISL